MTGFETLLEKLLVGRDLSSSEMNAAMRRIMAGELPQEQIVAFLVALGGKGETAAEIAAGARVMRDYATVVETGCNDLVDTCGTGGDGTSTFNISTASAIVAACMGARVAKHGNRSVSSSSGSADFLELAGVNIHLGADQVARCIREVGIGFLFAPVFHSAMRHVAGARRAIGIRSVFNLLGPLTNPARAECQLVGVFDAKWLWPMAEAAQALGVRRVMVVHAEDGMDEISIGAATRVVELRAGQMREYTLTPAELGLKEAPAESLAVGDAAASVAVVRRVFAGEAGAAADVVVANAAAAAYVAGRVDSLPEGAEKARDVLCSGAAADKLAQWVDLSRRLQGSG